jgi:putative NADH-flavin reductase
LVIKVKNKIMSEGKTPEIPKEWLERVERQKERVRNMSDEERMKWGFNPGETLEDKQERDERENPIRR